MLLEVSWHGSVLSGLQRRQCCCVMNVRLLQLVRRNIGQVWRVVVAHSIAWMVLRAVHIDADIQRWGIVWRCGLSGSVDSFIHCILSSFVTRVDRVKTVKNLGVTVVECRAVQMRL